MSSQQLEIVWDKGAHASYGVFLALLQPLLKDTAQRVHPSGSRRFAPVVTTVWYNPGLWALHRVRYTIHTSPPRAVRFLILQLPRAPVTRYLGVPLPFTRSRHRTYFCPISLSIFLHIAVMRLSNLFPFLAITTTVSADACRPRPHDPASGWAADGSYETGGQWGAIVRATPARAQLQSTAGLQSWSSFPGADSDNGDGANAADVGSSLNVEPVVTGGAFPTRSGAGATFTGASDYGEFGAVSESNGPLGFATKTWAASTYGFFSKPGPVGTNTPVVPHFGNKSASTSNDAKKFPNAPHSPEHRGNWLPGFDINTDAENNTPDTGVTKKVCSSRSFTYTADA